MIQVQLRSARSSDAVKLLLGKTPRPEDFGVLVTENADVYKPNGERLLTLIRGGLSKEATDAAYPFLHELRKYKTENRGSYAGSEIERPGYQRKTVTEGSKTRHKKLKRDGTVSKTNVAKAVASSIVGYFDRSARFPFCRQTIITHEYADMWGDALPMIQEAARQFQAACPSRYSRQLEEAEKTHPSYVIKGTPFTTLTVNNCVAGAYHTDKGDFGPGFGVIAVVRRGSYGGCWLGFPKYACAVDLQDRDVLMFDPHEVHGNTPFINTVGEEGKDWERISIVFYYRSKMIECKDPKTELAAAKARRGSIADENDAALEEV